MPVVWLIDAYRAGERGQVRALVDALGWPGETKVLTYRKAVFWPHLFGAASINGITRASAAQLTAPWPDLVVSCGVRNEPVCRWIREQSGGRTRYVHIGRPWARLDSFDLVVTTPQYRVPDAPNVLNNMLTLHSVNSERLAAARQQWQQAFADLPRPHFAVVVGGDSGPFTLGPKAAARLGREASALARANGGSLLVTTSARTRDSAVDALQDAIDAPHYFYRWRADAAENPYMGILAWADRLVVTGDSIAMLSEACATGKPVKMFDLGGMRPGFEDAERDGRLGATLYAFLMRWLWQPLSRDITLVHSRLREAGFAMWTDEVLATARVPGETDLERSVAAVRALLGES
ncbi:MAG: ELM1/GtrOC1 family putative glycosyltransferase [Halioglobus sp.]|nr:ELM1/GtrOC1 family putative glycosyltransferase [Halioglobus sp.]